MRNTRCKKRRCKFRKNLVNIKTNANLENSPKPNQFFEHPSSALTNLLPFLSIHAACATALSHLQAACTSTSEGACARPAVQPGWPHLLPPANLHPVGSGRRVRLVFHELEQKLSCLRTRFVFQPPLIGSAVNSCDGRDRPTGHVTSHGNPAIIHVQAHMNHYESS